MTVKGTGRGDDMASSERWLTEGVCDAATMLYQTLPACNSKNTACIVAKELQERATIDSESWNSCSESVSDDWASESSLDRRSTPETPPKEPVICDDDSEYMLFPSLPSSVDRPALDQVARCELAWDQCHFQFQRQSGSTISTLVHAAWALVATRMTCSDKVGFGVTDGKASVSSTRSLRVDCAAGQSVLMYLQTVQALAASQKALMAPPGDRQKNGSRSGTLISIQTSIDLQDCRDQDWESERDTMDSNSLPNLEGYALILKLRPQGAQFQAEAIFDGRSIEPWLMPRLLKRVESCMQQLHGADPSKRLGDIEIMSPDDLETIWKWNGTLPAAVERCMHHIFQDQARSQPWALAVDAWDGQLTYAELDQLSERLACRLVNLGVKADVMIPLCFEKSMWVPVAMLAVLKAGGAFSLLEPTFPEQRLQTIVEELNATVMLSSPSNMPLSLRLLDTVVQVDSDSLNSLSDDPNPPRNSQLSSTAMFAVFTSGSTGNPKGAVLTHTNYSSALAHQLQRLGFTRQSRVFDFASYAFDVSVHNVFATLTSGACLCIPSDQDRRNEISKVMAEMRVTIAHLTPSVTRLIDPVTVPSLETIVFTGEPLPIDDVTRWWGKVNIVNEYGPAECTINTVNSCPISPEAATRIGPPVGVAGWIVDSENHEFLVPIGCVGELLVEGPLVGRGYINDTAKTAAAFIENPKWLLQGAPGRPGRSGRLYKTGDLVRYSEDGSLSFLGRKDVQVKIRGQRVDLGEVEHWVQSCVSQAEQVVAEVILPQANDPSPTLAAFIQSQEVGRGAAPDADAVQISSVPAEVQAKLAQHLPSYMVPTVFFWVAKLPMTPTGKLNRKGLREIGTSFSAKQLAEGRAAGHSGPKRQPSSEIEQKVREIWARVLGIASVTIGLDDNFFHLGGDSIASMKAVGQARELGIQVTVADIFHHPSLHDVAEHCHQILDSSPEHIPPFGLLGDDFDRASFLQGMSEQCALDPATIQDAYPCTRLQEGLIFLTSKRPGDYIEQSVLELAPNISLEGLRKAWEQVIRATPILRTRLAHHIDLGLLQLVLDEKAHWTETTGLEECLASDRKRSMSLGEPLSRFALVSDESGTPQWLIWTIHHAIYDGWSIPLVMDAVSQAYAGNLIEQGPQFQTFIKYVQRQDDKRAAEYWQRALQGFDAAPFPPPVPSVEQPVADSVVEHSFPSPKNTSGGVTTSMLIRAAWALVVGRMANADDVAFGSTLYGRNAAVAGLDKMVAPTIATVPVRVRFAGTQKVFDYLEAIQQEAAEMIPYEQTGLQKIASISPESQKVCQFQTHVVIQPEDSSHGKGLLGKWKSGSQEQWFSTYALTLELWLGADGTSASAMFDSRIIEPWIVKKMLRRLEWVIYQLDHATPTQTLSDLEMSLADDLEQIWQWNERVPEQVNRCVHDLLADQVQARPESPAICAWDGELTYSKLDALSTKLSIKLRELGIGLAKDLVPLCFEKSVWTAVAVLGVLKANAGFVLLDPHLPEQRLQAIMLQANGSLIVTCPSKKDLCSRIADKTVVLSWDYFSDPVVQECVQVPTASPMSVAYAIFTSGSTGAPKGVLVSHANAVSAQYYQAKIMGYTVNTRLFDFASYSFDVAISNIFSMLACGGCLCIPSEDDRKNHLERSIVSLHVNALDLTPSIIQLLSPERLPELCLLTLGGEPLRAADVYKWCGKVRICNAYGPSECTPTSTINCNPLDPYKATDIGKGAGVVTWVVDPDNHEELLPPGCTGELLLEGPLVGIGYLNDAAKTAAAFVKDPKWLLRGFASRTGRHGRLYKTGDLVKYNEDGSLVFVRRKDTQVKIRGQRVEPGEIEAVLRSHENVDDAIVVLQSQKGQESWLAGFVTVFEENDAVAQKQELSHARGTSHQKEQKVQSWGDQFDGETYVSIDTIEPEMIGRDFIGWSSMYDGSEIDKGEMNDWLDDTINTILNGGSAGHVLEIGTGSGMMLFNLASHGLESYIGVEPSARAVDFAAKTAKCLPALADKVHVFKGTAEDILRLDKPISPSLVVINSVIQYFPSQDYLLNIIQYLVNLGSVETIFLGDVRSYSLHKEFLATRTLHIVKEDASLEEFGHVLGNLEKVEPELLLDPAFFTSLPSRMSGVRHVEILPKRIKATNELSSYRYAAVLHIKPQHQQAQTQHVEEVSPDSWIDFTLNNLDRQSASDLLGNSSAAATVAMSNIPYRNIVYEREIVSTVEKASGRRSNSGNWLSALREESQRCPSLSAFDLAELARQAGYEVEISWARQYSQHGGLDAIFYRCDTNTEHRKTRTLFRFPTDHEGRAYHLLSSKPLRQQIEAKVHEELEKMLRSRLPSYMIPHSITVLDKMPVNHNGKTDRKLLSDRVQQKAERTVEKRSPSTTTQKAMQVIWSEVLNIEPSAIGIDDGFIQLGGNSLGAMKVVNMARQAGIKLEVADMFRHSTTSIQRLLETTSTDCDRGDDASTSAIVNRLMSDIARHDYIIASAQAEAAARVASSAIQDDPDKQLTVVLTGANGFIGTQILRQLLEHGRVGRVIAIVRGTSASAARKRAIDAAKKARWWTEFHGSMLEVWPGDLALPHLGLDEADWRIIADGAVDVFIHNGASVHFIKSYAALEAANVAATVQVLRVAVENPNMRLVYVSSARCCDPKEEQEEDVAAALAASPNGYNETKFVAEALVRRAAARSLPGRNQFAVVSPGLVVGTPTEGVANADDWIWRMTASCLRVGIFNADESGNWVPIADAAATAATIIDAAFDRSSPIVTQVKGGLTMGDFWKTLGAAGYTLRGEDAGRCMAAIRKDVEDNRETHPLGALGDMLEGLGDTANVQWADSWHRGGFSSPVRLRVALMKSVEFLSQVGVLPLPAATPDVGMVGGEATMGAFARSGG
ncbi:MAG: hypothetical protein L6R40_000838 [Gallowayella cf. fulva]|nr:MAG: hypothetical protein L6R40_000838 [Xanthomendoza cf. fulva]